VNWVFDADLRDFFTSRDQGWLLLVSPDAKDLRRRAHAGGGAPQAHVAVPASASRAA